MEAALREHMRKRARKGAKKGGRARANRMTQEERSASARKAALARWAKHRKTKWNVAAPRVVEDRLGGATRRRGGAKTSRIADFLNRRHDEFWEPEKEPAWAVIGERGVTVVLKATFTLCGARPLDRVMGRRGHERTAAQRELRACRRSSESVDF